MCVHIIIILIRDKLQVFSQNTSDGPTSVPMSRQEKWNVHKW